MLLPEGCGAALGTQHPGYLRAVFDELGDQFGAYALTLVIRVDADGAYVAVECFVAEGAGETYQVAIVPRAHRAVGIVYHAAQAGLFGGVLPKADRQE